MWDSTNMSRVNTHLFGALCDTRYSRDKTDTAAKSHPFESNTLHLVPVKHLRNLVATHPAAVGIEWINHVWDPFLPVVPVNRQASLSVSRLSLLKGMCTHLACMLWAFYQTDCIHDCIFCWRDQGGIQTLCHHCCAIRLSGLSSGCLPDQQLC